MSLKVTAKKDKEFALVSDLFLWDKNPKIVLRNDFDRLKKQIAKLGQFKPIIVTPEGEVIGGNSRLEALRALGIKEAWVSVVDPKSDAEKLEYALADNDQIGQYVEEQLAELVLALEDDPIELEDYKIDVGKDIDLRQVLSSIGADEDDSQPQPKDKRSVKCPDCGHEFEV